MMVVSFIIVAYNAGNHIKMILQDLLCQNYDHSLIEVLLIDSNSSDDTKSMMYEFQQKAEKEFKRIVVLDNPQKILPCGWNIALKEAAGDVILRVDAHASIPEDFISENVTAIKQGEKIVGGTRESISDEQDIWQRILLLVETSMFGSGIAKYRHSVKESYVNTLAHATYHKEVFAKVGKYDERLVRTEDNEMHYRMKVAGYQFKLMPSIKSFHHSRNTFYGILKQKFLNGYWIGLTMGIQPKCFSVYHFIPFLFVVSLAISILMFYAENSTVFGGVLAAYLMLNVLMTVLAIRKEKSSIEMGIIPFAFLGLHLAYGMGTLIGLLKMPFWINKQTNKA